MTEKRQFPKFDFDYFDNNGLDNESELMQMFAGKNKRVARIFNHNDDDDESGGEQIDPEKSYGLHLVSAERTSGVTSLSPVEPEIADKTAINEILKPSGVLSKLLRNNSSLRRTLFQQPKVVGDKTPRKELICSTPNNGRQESLFNYSQATTLSPIRSHTSTASTPPPLRGNDKENPRVVVEKTPSLTRYEDEILRQTRFENLKTPPKLPHKVSHASPASTVHNSGGKREPKLSQQEQPMEISETNAINNYRQSQLMQLNRCNQTNLNSMQIIETPVGNRRKTAYCDATLAEKLQRCESSSDSDLLTNDESTEKETVPLQKLPEIHEEVKAPNELTPVHETDTQESAVVEVVFKSPEPIKEKTKKKKNEVIASESMESTQVSASTVEYLNSLRMSVNEAAPSHEPPPPQTRRFSIPKRTRAKNNSKPKVGDHLIKLAKKSKAIKKKREIKGHKRTLYTQHSFSENNDGVGVQQHTTELDSPDLELAEAVAEVRQSLSHCSSTSTVFNGKIDTPEKRGKEPASEGNTEQSSEENSKQDETSNVSGNNFEDAPAGGNERARSFSSIKTKTRKLATRAVKSKDSLESQMPQQEEVSTAPAKAPEKRANKGRTKEKTTKKNAKRQVSDEHVPQTESNDEADHEMQEVASENSRSTRKAAFKRIHPPADSDDEPPTQKARGNEQQVESDDESGKSTNDDEGFESDGVPRPRNFKYDPNEHCPRKGLRVRKFPTAWWRHDAEAEQYGLVYGCYSRSDSRKVQETKKLMRKYKLNPVRVLSQGLAPGSINPDDALKEAKNIVEKKKKGAAKSSKGARTMNTMTAIPENLNEEAALAVNLMKAFDAARENSETESVSKSTEFYDIHQMNRLEWTPCGPEMFFHQFSHKKSDGFIKFLPGARKSTAKTKQSELKFVLLCGKIDFTINDEKETLENMGYISIKPCSKYSASNPYDQDAILSFTKFDAETTD